MMASTLDTVFSGSIKRMTTRRCLLARKCRTLPLGTQVPNAPILVKVATKASFSMDQQQFHAVLRLTVHIQKTDTNPIQPTMCQIGFLDE